MTLVMRGLGIVPGGGGGGDTIQVILPPDGVALTTAALSISFADDARIINLPDQLSVSLQDVAETINVSVTGFMVKYAGGGLNVEISENE